ncbi:dehydrogenase [Shewanella sp. Choline-02u-19]|uniref:FAD-dependent monooxygenase n=1 Tax=unclassified Shewanella TaxID=196818 RepID=UPI000C326D81|nr:MULTISPECIES: FAD-dependent monooxygenase [unclassified Shewanella]PKH53853.1 dehydrogenase [Shewanella sp. Bg11-22]PKI28895.1 dehydrogenase [Shewanella sp. Choline-02u-19]
MKPLYDVIIVGGGPAGCATAIALHNLGVKNTLVIEASDYTAPRIGESIPPDSRELLEKLGIWDAFTAQKHAPCLGSYSSWGSDQLGFNDYLFNPQGHGWHLNRCAFDKFLALQVEKRGGALLKNTHFASLVREQHAYPIKVLLRNNAQLRCRFIVDATGRSAKVARQFNAKAKIEDQLVAVSAYFDSNDVISANSYRQMTLLEAVDYGWWYLAHLPNNKVIVTVATDPQTVKDKHLKDPRSWLQAMQLTQHIQPIISQSTPSSLHTWVAQSAIMNPPAAEHWLTVGDAASIYDPISSQGIYKALKNGIDAADAIVDWLDNNAQTINQYRNNIGNNFIQYLAQKAYFYSEEQRWPESTFWKSRQQPRQ